jgi:hypothetical protein
MHRSLIERPFLRSKSQNSRKIGPDLSISSSLWDKLTNRFYLGSEAWLKTIRRQIETKPRSTDHPRMQRAASRPRMNTIVSAVAKAAGETAESIRSKRGHILRNLTAWLGWHVIVAVAEELSCGVGFACRGIYLRRSGRR